MTEVLLGEINRKPTEGTDRRLQREVKNNNNNNRKENKINIEKLENTPLCVFFFVFFVLKCFFLPLQSYALAAGFALGLVTLGRGADAVGLADLKIEEKLSTYIHGSTVKIFTWRKRKRSWLFTLR